MICDFDVQKRSSLADTRRVSTRQMPSSHCTEAERRVLRCTTDKRKGGNSDNSLSSIILGSDGGHCDPGQSLRFTSSFMTSTDIDRANDSSIALADLGIDDATTSVDNSSTETSTSKPSSGNRRKLLPDISTNLMTSMRRLSSVPVDATHNDETKVRQASLRRSSTYTADDANRSTSFTDNLMTSMRRLSLVAAETLKAEKCDQSDDSDSDSDTSSEDSFDAVVHMRDLKYDIYGYLNKPKTSTTTLNSDNTTACSDFSESTSTCKPSRTGNALELTFLSKSSRELLKNDQRFKCTDGSVELVG